MKTIKNYEEFCNEEINLKKALIGGAFAGLMGAGLYHTSQINKFAELEDTEVISNQKFNQYDVFVNGQTFDLNISEDGIISAEWSESSGKTSHTYRCVTVPEGISELWIDVEMDAENGIFVSSKPISGCKKISLTDLDVYDETDTYIVYNPGFLSSVDYIIVDKGHKEGEEFKIQNKMGNWICDQIGSKIYIFSLKDMGGGSSGGGGAEGDW